MNTTEKYIYQVYTEKSFSKAAKTLFVSQPSLSAAISHKEKELGFQIFDRSTKPISLTAQGHIYVDMLEEILESESKMRLRVQKLLNEKHNSIGIGGGSSAVYYLMSSICGSFYRRYPEIEVMIDLGNFSAEAVLFEKLSHFQKLDRGELDVVFSYNFDQSKYFAEPIYRERLVVAMHKELVPKVLAPYAVTRDELLHGTYTLEKEIQESNPFRDIPFLDFSRAVNTGRYMSELLGDYSTSSYKISNARHSVVHFNMMCAGVGALLTSDCMVALSNVDPENILYFIFKKEISTRNIYLVTRKDVLLNSSTKKFINVAKEVCGSEKPLTIYNNT